MDDNTLLAELRAQRELIRKHLEWLDQQIGNIVDNAGESPDAETNENAPSPNSTQASEPAEDEPATKLKAEVDDEASEPQTENNPESWFSSYKAPSGDDIIKAKIGCFVLFILSTLLFLFLLFGLPYLMN